MLWIYTWAKNEDQYKTASVMYATDKYSLQPQELEWVLLVAYLKNLSPTCS
jgi:hypothetical protein